jgi:hypothetical protein
MPHEIVFEFICTAQKPWAPDIQGRVMHPDAVSAGDTDDGFEQFVCPHCGKHFEVELPQ